jgi:hypothetical protein
MIRLGTHPLTTSTPRPWRAVLAATALVAALGFAATSPAKADDVPRPARPNYVQYEHDAVVHSQQLTESRAADAAKQEGNQRAAGQDQNGAWQARNLATPNAATNQ